MHNNPDFWSFVLLFGGMLINAIWTVFNARAMRKFEERMDTRYVSQSVCAGKHALVDERHLEHSRRLQQAGV